jgi:hypothetical protein
MEGDAERKEEPRKGREVKHCRGAPVADYRSYAVNSHATNLAFGSCAD